MVTKDNLGDHLKKIENKFTNIKPENGQCIYVRIDGNRFSKFTRGMERPFDSRMLEAMQNTAHDVAKAFDAEIFFVQSDEISLVLTLEDKKDDAQFIHNGKIQKLVSRTASSATGFFYRHAMAAGLQDFIEKQFPEFDSRVVFTDKDTAGLFIEWRIRDAKKNSISMLAQHHFSHKKLQKKNTLDMLGMLNEIGVDYESYNSDFRNGALFYRQKVRREMTKEEMEKIPEKFRPSDNMVDRNEYVKMSNLLR